MKKQVPSPSPSTPSSPSSSTISRLSSFRRANSARRISINSSKPYTITTNTAAASIEKDDSSFETVILNPNGSPIPRNKTNNSSTSNDNNDDKNNTKFNNVMISAFEFKGLELIISCQNPNPNENPNHRKSCINLIIARSRMLFQSLEIDDYDLLTDHDNNDNFNKQQGNLNRGNDDEGNDVIYSSFDNDEIEIMTKTATDTTTTTTTTSETTKTNNENSNQHSKQSSSSSLPSSHFPKIVTLKTNPVTGYISIITSNFKCIIYHPIPSKPNNNNNNKNTSLSSITSTPNPTTAFGNHIWMKGHVIDLKKTFNMNDVPFLIRKLPTNHKRYTNTVGSDGSNDRRKTKNVFLGMSSIDDKLLIGYDDQIAIYSIPQYQRLQLLQQEQYNNGNSIINKPILQWTTKVRTTIANCDISGDGRSIVYTLENEGIGTPYPSGIRTFVRDLDDGSLDHTTKKNLNKHNDDYDQNIVDMNQGSGSGGDDNSSSSTSATRSSNKDSNTIKPPRSPPKSNQVKWKDKSSSSPPKPSSSYTSSSKVQINDSFNNNMGILYKSGPLLIHSDTVTRLSFRGYGMNYSSIISDYYEQSKKKRKSSKHTQYNDQHHIIEGNDLLLTCANDGSMRVFSQGTWKLLLHWDTPPGSRADWIQGMTMANLGDLDPFPKSSKKRKSNSSNSSLNGDNDNYSGGSSNVISKQLLKKMTARNGSSSTQVQTVPTSTTTTASGGWNTHQSPQCAAGAWISELTFRGSFPALRLSRLSFLKSGGGDAWAPAHFESVAAILPPTTVLPQAVLEPLCGDEGIGMVVQGLWPAWNRWVAHPNSQSGVVEDESLSGNAMALIGAVPQGVMSSNVSGGVGVGGLEKMGTFGGTGGMSMASFGGSHSPPSELRLIASHPDGDKVVVMEFPLWGDSDFGAMELGSPIRHVLSLNEEVPDDVIIDYGQKKNDQKNLPLQRLSTVVESIDENDVDLDSPSHAPLPVTVSTRCACLDFESNNLCAVVSKDRKHIGLSWRRKGTMNIIKSSNPAPLGDFKPLQRTSSNGSIASTMSLDSDASQTSFLSESLGNVIDQFKDMSILPLPLSLPKLYLPASSSANEYFSLLKWWPDENFGGPPRLFALTNLGTLILYEMPPPWSALEPIMPMDDPFSADCIGSVDGMGDSNVVSEHGIDEEGVIYENERFRQENDIISEYEVQVTPHPDFGLGLRLEAQTDGMPAIAGSYKKHPLTGGRLPAERTGKIVLGDELVSVNDVSLEGMTFDDIISSVRVIGQKSQGGPLNMKFRCVDKNRILREKLSNLSSEHESFEEGLEVIHQRNNDEAENNHKSASAVMGVDADIEQGFGRVISVISDALPSFTDSVKNSPRSLLLLPWHYGKGAPAPYEIRGVVLLVSAVGRMITASRLELLNCEDIQTCGKLNLIGSFELRGRKNDHDIISPVKSLEIIKNSGDGWCVAACDEEGDINLVFIDIVDSDESEEGELKADFRADFIFNCYDQQEKSQVKIVKDFLVRAPSIELIGTMPVGGLCNTMHVWSPTPYIYYQNDKKEMKIKDDSPTQSYSLSIIYHRGETTCNSQSILDFRWISSGYVDAFPWLVTFSDKSVVLHRRPGWHNKWVAIAEFTYPINQVTRGWNIEMSTSYKGSLSPVDAHPHTIAALHSVVTVSDERNYMKADWCPDSMLAFLCSDPEGIEISIQRHLSGLLKWLSNWMDPTDSSTFHWNDNSKLPCAPFEAIYNASISIFPHEDESTAESATTLMKSFSNSKSTNKNDNVLLIKFLNYLKNLVAEDKEDYQIDNTNNKGFTYSKSQSAQKDNMNELVEENSLPEPLKFLSRDELCLLYALGELSLNPPKFQKLDESAKLTLFAISLVRQVQTLDIQNNACNDLNPKQFGDNRIGSGFLLKQTSFKQHSSKPSATPSTISSAAVLSALLSNSQNHLLQYCRKQDVRLDWNTAREVNLPLWLRSDEELKKISQEIGQSTYKSTMDVLEAALFYIVIGNMQMLKAIAATDKNQSGKTFFNFLTNHDFASQRGRTAAEKNAFSLLRKRRYRPAVAFFLLAQPPMLNSALDVIVTKMEDFSLAFFVARLVDKYVLSHENEAGFSTGLTIGGGLALGRMGGGGGFASTSDSVMNEPQIESLYGDWKPKLSNFSRNLIEKHGLESNDYCAKAALLLWLGRSNDAAICVLGHDDVHEKNIENFTKDESMSLSSLIRCRVGIKTQHGNSSKIISDANAIIDFTSRPNILHKMKVPDHVLWYASLQISRALCQSGFEIPAILILSHNKEKIESNSDAIGNDPAINPPKVQNLNSSIFDDYTIPFKTAQKPVAQQPTSSIFDTFEPVIPTSAIKSQQMNSSIFDTFDTPSQATTSASAQKKEESSSIFDSYDVPKVHKVASSNSGMSSSIFDAFDTPSQVTKTVSVPNKEASSSIFDSYDVPRMKNKSTESNVDNNNKVTNNSVCKGSDQPDKIDSCISEIDVPPIWVEWKRNILTSAVARRLLREMARIIGPILGDVEPTPIKLFRRHVNPLIPSGSSHVLQEVCDGETVLSLVVEYLEQLCSTFSVSKHSVMEQALLLLACPNHPQRIVFAVLIHCLTSRADLAEDVMRLAAQDQIQRCESFIAANDDLVHYRKTKHYISSQYIRRTSAAISLQLELCLWLHRGGAFPMSGIALKETVMGVRIGLVIAAWGRCDECLEYIIKCEPDCSMDFDRGRQLWSSMKIILSYCGSDEENKGASETTSGGWEFLVDCNRKEATDLLKHRKCGSFLLRPHPDDHGVFTLSFRTNLIAEVEKNSDEPTSDTSDKKAHKGNDVVQHAVVRLSDAGFKCGSFGPFSSLLKLLEAVSSSLPFDLLFSDPPAQGIIKEEGGQPSPSAVFIRKLALHSKTEHYRQNIVEEGNSVDNDGHRDEPNKSDKSFQTLQYMGLFSQLIVLTELRKQFSAIVAAEDVVIDSRSNSWDESKNVDDNINLDEVGEEEMDAIATRIIRPFLNWCRALELAIVHQILPTNPDSEEWHSFVSSEMIQQNQKPHDHGDGIIRRMIQPRSGVDFRTLRVGEAGHSAVIVLFRKSEAISWIVSSGAEKNASDAIKRLDMMERQRVIEQVDLKLFAPDKQVVVSNGHDEDESDETDKEVRFRFVDPWEVEVIESKDEELRSASLGRDRYVPFSLGLISRACQVSQQNLGGLHLLSLWSAVKGGVCLTKTFASAFSPWERDAGGDLNVVNGMVTQPSSYTNSFRQHLYRNALFRRLNLPQRFIALIQVELLDLKNLTAPGGSPSITAYALLRLKRDASNAPLTHKARTLDSASTEPRKIAKSSGPNQPASWGSVVRFRFPLPEGVNCDGVSLDKNREALFKGAPSVLQLSVYEKKFMNDLALGGADVKFDGLSTDGQVEEWVPLRSTRDEITWFARIRLMLRFELMCIDTETPLMAAEDNVDSAGLKKIRVLSRIGGAHEDAKGVVKSVSAPDMVNALQNMV